MSTLEDVRKTVEGVIGNLTPAKAQEVAKGFSDPGTAKEQVAKVAAELIEWSQRNRDRMKEFVGREIASQMRSVGVAQQSDLDALKKRVRDLERRAGMTASGRKVASKKSTVKKTAAKKTSASSPKPASAAS